MVSEKKKKLVENLTRLIQTYPVIALVNMHNLPAQQLQTMRARLLKKDVIIAMTRKKLLQLALKNSQKQNINQLSQKIKGMPALLLSKKNPFALYSILQKNKSSAPAKPNQTAPKDIIVPAGPTNFAPGPIISELASIGIKTKVESGKLTINEDTTVAKEGDTISQKLAELLKRLDIQPMEIGLDLVAAWEKEIVFDAQQLYIDEAEYLNNIIQAFQEAFNLAIEITYPTPDNIELLLQKAFQESKSLALEENILTDLTTEEILAKTEQQAVALKEAAKLEVSEKKIEEKEEKPKEEPKKEELKEIKKEEKKEELKPEPAPPSEPKKEEKPKEEKPAEEKKEEAPVEETAPKEAPKEEKPLEEAKEKEEIEEKGEEKLVEEIKEEKRKEVPVKITYFVHGTITDNEQGIATGWSPGELSELGKKQSIELKELIKDKKFDVVFCSDLKRAVDSAKLTFEDEVPIIQDERLRECNYGDLTRADSKEVGSQTLERIDKPFPNGESYKDVGKRIRSFLNDLLEKYPGRNVAIVAHKAPQLALDVLLKGKTWEQAIKEDWRLKEPKEWKPGWDYKLEKKIEEKHELPVETLEDKAPKLEPSLEEKKEELKPKTEDPRPKTEDIPSAVDLIQATKEKFAQLPPEKKKEVIETKPTAELLVEEELSQAQKETPKKDKDVEEAESLFEKLKKQGTLREEK